MSDVPLGLTRAQLEKFLPDARAIRAFEQMLKQTGELLPSEIQNIYRLIDEVTTETASGTAKGQQALDTLSRIADALDILSAGPSDQRNNSVATDYIDFNSSPAHTDKPRRLAWNDADDTVNIHHTGGVTQQVGIESYSRITNVSGAPILNGKAVSLANVGIGAPIGGQYYIADGSIPSLYVLGVATQDIAAGAVGFVTVRGLVRDIDTTGTPYGEVWAIGDVLYASPTTPGALTRVKPTAPNIVLPMALVVVASSTAGVLAVRPAIFLQLYYGFFYSSVAQTAAAINTAYAITFNTTSISAGVSIGAPTSRIVCANSGYYEFTFSVQAVKSTAAVGYLRVWLRKNGVNVPATTARIALQGSTAESLLTRTLPLSMAAGDYAELMWAVDSTAISLFTDPATAYSPVAPSATMAVAQINQ